MIRNRLLFFFIFSLFVSLSGADPAGHTFSKDNKDSLRAQTPLVLTTASHSDQNSFRSQPNKDFSTFDDQALLKPLTASVQNLQETQPLALRRLKSRNFDSRGPPLSI